MFNFKFASGYILTDNDISEAFQKNKNTEHLEIKVKTVSGSPAHEEYDSDLDFIRRSNWTEI